MECVEDLEHSPLATLYLSIAEKMKSSFKKIEARLKNIKRLRQITVEDQSVEIEGGANE